MENLTILKADTYTVLNKNIISDIDKKVITLLYQPIIGSIATSLYFTLLDDIEKNSFMSEDLTHGHLLSKMQIKIEDILVAREKLEAVGLMKTYVKKDTLNNYVYVVFAPMEAYEFFNHPVLNIVLFNNLGKKEYDKVLNLFKLPRVQLKDYEDITAKFQDIFDSVKGDIIENTEVVKKEKSKIEIDENIDFNFLISGIPEANEKCFTADIKELINSLAFTYNLKTIDMQGLVRDALNEKGLIDKTKLRKAARNYYQFDNDNKLPTLIYNKKERKETKKEVVEDATESKYDKVIKAFETLTPYQFLKIKYKGAEPTKRDKILVESLLTEQKFKPGVVNVLIDYVLKVNNQSLNKGYVETIAGQWKRLNIETVEDAMKIAEQENKKKKKQQEKKTEKEIKTTASKKNKTELPEWFDGNNKKEEISADEFNELLKNF